MRRRSTAIDALKGGLVLLMIAYHACYIAVMFGLAAIDLYSGFWWMFPRAIAAGFVALSGWNLAGKRARGGAFRAFAKRSGTLALVAVAISAATWPIFGESFVFFGVIHLLALSAILSYPLLSRPVAATAVGVACLAIGLAIGGLRFDAPWLAWLGLRPAKLFPVDYLPLLPWFGFVAFGAAAYGIAARARGAATGAAQARPAARKPEAPAPAPAGMVAILAAVGRNSLLVYLVHLPALYGIGWALSALRR
jgi:uncharacterized membrane protein